MWPTFRTSLRRDRSGRECAGDSGCATVRVREIPLVSIARKFSAWRSQRVTSRRQLESQAKKRSLVQRRRTRRRHRPSCVRWRRRRRCAATSRCRRWSSRSDRARRDRSRDPQSIASGRSTRKRASRVAGTRGAAHLVKRWPRARRQEDQAVSPDAVAPAAPAPDGPHPADDRRTDGQLQHRTRPARARASWAPCWTTSSSRRGMSLPRGRRLAARGMSKNRYAPASVR